jgi:hypothetical protein
MSAPATPKVCATCATPLSRGNRSGYCKRHVSAAKAQDPAWREAQRAGAKRALQVNPERLDALRARVRAMNITPEKRARTAEHAKRIGLHAIGQRTANSPESIAKRAAASVSTKLAWCPPHLREQYRHLLYVKRIPAAEARAMILAQEAAEIAEMRRRLEWAA